MYNDEIEIKLKIKRLSTPIVLLISVLLVSIFGVFDYLLGYELSFSIFYLIPISISVLLGDFKTGVFTSILSAISWYLSDKFSGNVYSQPLIPVWNATMRLGYFLLHSFYLNKILFLNKKFLLQSHTDSLTGVYNSSFFTEILNHEREKAKRTNKPITVAYIDLDNFKKVNDTYGHSVGDELLKKIAEVIKSNIRSSDILARLGGDEFALCLPETDFNNASTIIDRIRKCIIEAISISYPVTLSIGVVTYTNYDFTAEKMISNADNLMYEVKMEGKNNFKHIVI